MSLGMELKYAVENNEELSYLVRYVVTPIKNRDNLSKFYLSRLYVELARDKWEYDARYLGSELELFECYLKNDYSRCYDYLVRFAGATVYTRGVIDERLQKLAKRKFDCRKKLRKNLSDNKRQKLTAKMHYLELLYKDCLKISKLYDDNITENCNEHMIIL